jgi:hypothetical protein
MDAGSVAAGWVCAQVAAQNNSNTIECLIRGKSFGLVLLKEYKAQASRVHLTIVVGSSG